MPVAELALSIQEVADKLGISTRLVYEMVYHKTIPFKRLQGSGKRGQGRIVIPRRQFEEWLAVSEQPAASMATKKQLQKAR